MNDNNRKLMDAIGKISDSHIEEFAHVNPHKKNKAVWIRIISAAACVTLLALAIPFFLSDNNHKIKEVSDTNSSGVHDSNKPGNTQNITDSDKNKAYPYKDRIEYLPKNIPVSKYQNGFLAYNQIKNINDTTINIYAALYDRTGMHKDCSPSFDENENIVFSRKSYAPDTDEVRYNTIMEYLNADNKNIVSSLVKLPDITSTSVNCNIHSNQGSDEVSSVSFEVPIFDNCKLDVIVSNNLNAISNNEIHSFSYDMNTILKSKTSSVIYDKPVAISYIYQTRHCDEHNNDEERFIYYALFEKNNQEYLIQFSSNYTLKDSNKSAYGIEGKTQEQCKKAFEDIVFKIAKI